MGNSAGLGHQARGKKQKCGRCGGDPLTFVILNEVRDLFAAASGGNVQPPVECSFISG